ncbi:GTA-gp10 family protein, partial [Rhodobacter lacus]
MANPFKGEVDLTHGGVRYTMVLDFNALCDFEGETGKNALTALEGMEAGKISASDLRVLMWAGLRQRHPEMTLALAGQ